MQTVKALGVWGGQRSTVHLLLKLKAGHQQAGRLKALFFGKGKQEKAGEAQKITNGFETSEQALFRCTERHRVKNTSNNHFSRPVLSLDCYNTSFRSTGG